MQTFTEDVLSVYSDYYRSLSVPCLDGQFDLQERAGAPARMITGPSLQGFAVYALAPDQFEATTLI